MFARLKLSAMSSFILPMLCTIRGHSKTLIFDISRPWALYYFVRIRTDSPEPLVPVYTQGLEVNLMIHVYDYLARR